MRWSGSVGERSNPYFSYQARASSCFAWTSMARTPIDSDAPKQRRTASCKSERPTPLAWRWRSTARRANLRSQSSRAGSPHSNASSRCRLSSGSGCVYVTDYSKTLGLASSFARPGLSCTGRSSKSMKAFHSSSPSSNRTRSASTCSASVTADSTTKSVRLWSRSEAARRTSESVWLPIRRFQRACLSSLTPTVYTQCLYRRESAGDSLRLFGAVALKDLSRELSVLGANDDLLGRCRGPAVEGACSSVREAVHAFDSGTLQEGAERHSRTL